MLETRLIISEGDTDLVFFQQVIKKYKIQNLRAIPRNDLGKFPSGDGTFELMLRAIHTGSPYGKIALVVVAADCDSCGKSQFENVARQIKNAESYAVPTRPLEIAKESGKKSASVLLMPWHDCVGALETMCLQL